MSNVLSDAPSFSPWEMFLHAGIVVRLIMILLLIACMVSWVIFIAKSLELRYMHKTLIQDSHTLDTALSLNQGKEKTSPESTANILIMAAYNEQEKSRDMIHYCEGIKERIAMHLERLEAAEGRRLARGTAILATIGATAPFIGLFGTVWGIMTSFTGIAASKATSLAVVAPGIAEALLATAFGLLAAIPAVIIYNDLLRKTALCRALLADLTTQVMRLVSRDMDRNKIAPPAENRTFRIMPRLAGE